MQSKKFYEKLGNSKFKVKREKLDSKDVFLINTFSSTNLDILEERAPQETSLTLVAE
jgi:hypothetical protein